MSNKDTLRPVRTSLFKFILLLTIAPLALIVGYLLYERGEALPQWQHRKWVALVFTFPILFWLACWRKNKHSALLSLGAALLGFFVASTLFAFAAKAVWIDHQFLTVPFGGIAIDGSILALVAVAGLIESIRYCLLFYALHFENARTEQNIALTCVSLALGAASGGLLCNVLFDNLSLLSPTLFTEFSQLVSKELAIASIWIAVMSRRSNASNSRLPMWCKDLFAFVLIVLAQSILSAWFTMGSKSWIPILVSSTFAALAAARWLRPQIVNNKPDTLDVRVFACFCFAVATLVVTYRFVATPQLNTIKVKGLSFSHPSHWMNLQPKSLEVKSSNPFSISQRPDHFEIVSPTDLGSRIEIRIADKYEGSLLRSSLHMNRTSRFGDHQSILSETYFDHGGRDWHRTHFSYPYHFDLGSPLQLLHGVEYAIVDGNYLYVVTVHGRENQISSLDAIVSGSLTSSRVE